MDDTGSGGRPGHARPARGILSRRMQHSAHGSAAAPALAAGPGSRAAAARPAIFLDRDNTLIVNDPQGPGHDGDLGDPALVQLRPGVAASLRALREAATVPGGYRLVVVTNQGGVARGKYTEADVDAVHQRIATLVDTESQFPGGGVIDRFYYCPYHPEGSVKDYRREHPWRKPAPGMILQAARDLGLDLSRSWMIGDQERDVAAGQAAGVRTVLISTDREQIARAQPTVAAATLTDAVDRVLREPRMEPDSFGAPRTEHHPPRWDGEADAPADAAPGTELDPLHDPLDAATVRGLRRAITELTDELRSERLRRAEFTPLKMAAGACQLFTLLLALLGLLQVASADQFFRWMIGAALMQLLVIAVLLMDSRG
jgi:D-glycero-D-manno-heptose 1,7-bisphosphate phosphatase